MSLKLWMGKSGQGKTYEMISHVINESEKHPEKFYYMIVPEQFGLEMQRELVRRHPDHGYFNIDVLSFHRLAYQMFEECCFKPYDMLEDLGVSMVLRKILSEHESELIYFKKSAKKAGFIDELKSVLMELICYEIRPGQLTDLVDRLTDHPNLSRKCEEIGKIYAYFEEAIEGRYMVSEQILDVATELVPKSDVLRKGIFFFDGFTGFTPVQLKFLEAMLEAGISIHVSLTMDEPAFGKKGSSWEDLFYLSRNTADSLNRICQMAHDPMEEPVVICHETAPRFQNNPEIAALEAGLFRQEGRNKKKRVWSEDGEPSRIHVTSCYNREAEAEYIIHKIEQLVRQDGYRYKDIAVLSADMDGYAFAFERQCDILGIPVFVDTKKKMSYYAGVETVRSLFHLAQMNCSYESVFRYLKSGMSDLMPKDVDYLENYVIGSGIRGLSMWKKPFSRKLKNMTDEDLLTPELLRKQFLSETEAVTEAFCDPELTVKEKMTALFWTLHRLSFEEKLKEQALRAKERGDFTKMREYERLYGLILDLLDKIVEIFGEEKMPLKVLSEIMDAGLSEMGLGVEPLSMDQIVLGDLKRTRLPEVKVLFIAGFNDGMIPPVLEDRGLIHDDEKALLSDLGINLSENLFEKSLEDEFYLYQAFTKPEDHLYFTYSSVGADGKTIRPSLLLSDLRKIFPGLPVKAYPEEEKRFYFNLEDSRELLITDMEKYKKNPGKAKEDPAFGMLISYWNQKPEQAGYLEKLWTGQQETGKTAPLTTNLAKELYGEELVGSVTRLEAYASCPYAYFCQYGLGLYEREEYKIQSFDLGNIFHNALESFSKQVKNSEYNWKNLPEKEEGEFIHKAIEAAVDENTSEIFKSSARNGHRILMVERILTKTVKTLRTHLSRSAFEPDRFELRFGKDNHLKANTIPLSGGSHMRLEGKIDRVDIVEDEDQILVKIIDYKSGNKTFEYSDLYYGINLQLVIYMNAAREYYENETGKAVVPAGLYYYTLKDPIFDAKDGTVSDHMKEFRMEGVTNDDPYILEKLEPLSPSEKDMIQVNVTYKNDGKPTARSKVAKTEDFLDLGDYAVRKAKEIGDRIYEGEISAKPYMKKDREACTYCKYKSVCGFEKNMPGFEYHELKTIKPEDVLKLIRGESKE